MGKDTRHLARAAMLLGLTVAVILGARFVMTPESFGDYGYYRGANVAEWSGRPPMYADTSQCGGCHLEVYSMWTRYQHRGVSCENCHGPGTAHIERPEREPVVVDRTVGLCLLCHEETDSRPSDFPQVEGTKHSHGLACISCHSPHDPTPGQHAPVAHPVEPSADCLQCHWEWGVKPEPLQHQGRTTDTCLRCHQPGVSPTPKPAPTPVPPPMPPVLDGRTECMLCHEAGVAGATVLPEDHGGGAGNVCMVCHEKDAIAAPTPVPEPARVETGPPLITHTIEARGQCLLCHSSGMAGATIIPDDHAGKAVDTCLTCHKEAN